MEGAGLTFGHVAGPVDGRPVAEVAAGRVGQTAEAGGARGDGRDDGRRGGRASDGGDGDGEAAKDAHGGSSGILEGRR